MSKKVLIGCRLPHGLILEHPLNPDVKVTLKGKNSRVVAGLYVPEQDFAMTEVDSDFWEAWIATNKAFPAITSNAIFVAKDAGSAESIAKELRNEATGMEQLDPVKESEVKPLDKK